MQVTYAELITFRNRANQYQQYHGGKFSPLLYAIAKVIKKTDKLISDYNEKLLEINQEFGDKDKDGYFKLNNVGTPQECHVFKPEDMKKRDTKIKELNKTLVDVEAHIPADIMNNIPADIGFEWWENLAPFVLPE